MPRGKKRDDHPDDIKQLDQSDSPESDIQEHRQGQVKEEDDHIEEDQWDETEYVKLETMEIDDNASLATMEGNPGDETLLTRFNHDVDKTIPLTNNSDVEVVEGPHKEKGKGKLLSQYVLHIYLQHN